MAQQKTRVTILGGGRLAYGALGMLRPAVGRGEVTVTGWARADAGQKVLGDGGATVVPGLQQAVEDAQLLIFALPAHALAEVADAAGPFANGEQVALHASRGITAEGLLPHQVIRQHTPIKKVAVLGGPLYLDDAREGRALNAALAARYDEALILVQQVVDGAPLRIASTHDVVGVELCGVLSNIAHLASGLAAGVGLSETDQGLLTVRALLEASRLGRTIGAERATFSGLAGVGDLIPRRVSSQWRHRDLGQRFTAGEIDATAFEKLEGAISAVAVDELAARHELRLPLVAGVRQILEGANARATLQHILELDLGLTAVGV